MSDQAWDEAYAEKEFYCGGTYIDNKYDAQTLYAYDKDGNLIKNKKKNNK